MLNYNGKRFRIMGKFKNSELSADTIFEYKQKGSILQCQYSNGKVLAGHLLGTVNDKGYLSMVYHQVNESGEIKTGSCHSTPQILPTGKIILHESWQWTSGDRSSGESTLEEI